MFYDCTSLVEVMLPKNLKVLESALFSGCSQLEKIEIPLSVTRVEYGAFVECTKLKQVKISKNVDYLDPGAFIQCNTLEKYVVDSQNSEYATQNGMLMNKEKTEIISYPAGKKGKTFTCPTSIKKIGKEAFLFNNTIKKVVLNGQEIGEYAFAYMSNLRTVNWKGKAKIVPRGAFEECKKLKKVVLPNSIRRLDTLAFYKTALKKFKVPKSLSTMGSTVFGKKYMPKKFILGKNKNFKVKNGRLKQK